MAKQIDKTLYDEKSIESLSPLEFTRLRPQVYCGDTTYSTQLLVEILSNALDEVRVGHGSVIDIIIADTHMSVKDYGQGFIPNSFREDGKTILEAAFSVLNTSGKYREDGTYEGTSLGSFGIGSKLACFLSHWLDVTTFRDGIYENVKFKEGIFYHRNVGKISNFKKLDVPGTEIEQIPSHGTWVTWEPSEEFFTHVNVELSKVRDLCETVTALCPGLTINLTTKNGTEKYHSKNGINDLLDVAVANKEIIKNRFNMKFEQGKNKMDMVFTYTSMYSSTIVPYVNTGLTETGPHISQTKAIITREFNKFFKEKKWLKDKDENLTGDDIQEGLYIIFNITAPNVAYDAQVKSRVTKLDMTPFTGAIAENIQYWLANNEKEIKSIFDKAAAAKKAREAAKEARERVRDQKKKKEKAVKFDSKLADCWSRDRTKCEIYVTEGDSASGNLKEARDAEFQAILPVRGKILNVRKASLDKIQKNAEIMTMIEAFGLRVDMKTMKLTYDPKELRYGKIIIESDADVDGSHIKNLFYTFIWTFCPQLIIDGYIYGGVPPLYKITEGKDTYLYLKNDEALEEYKVKNKGKKFQVNRLKGLGELSSEETSILTDPTQRIIQKITVKDVQKANKLFDDLMGEAVVPRKNFIRIHAKEATYGE